jgi:hypothetical protein
VTETVIVALISAIGGSLIKPLFDYLTQRESSKDDRDIAAYERAIAELDRKDKDLKEAKADAAEAEERLEEWRAKYYELFVKTNAAGMNPDELKNMLKEIIEKE